MLYDRTPGSRFHKERGMTLLLVTASLFVLLGMAALAIDLASLYVARSEAQRAADAAALAAAMKVAELGYTGGGIASSAVEPFAEFEAISTGEQNYIGGEPASIIPEDVVFDWSEERNPRVTVTVHRTVDRGNPMPTFFAKALGIVDADVSAVATAEAYNETGAAVGPSSCRSCVKPWMLPNCDPYHANEDDDVDPYCPPGSDRYINETGSGEIVNDGPAPYGVIGQQIVIKPGNPNEAPVPSKYYIIGLPSGEFPSQCPDCAKEGGTGEVGSSLYRYNIACCNTNQFQCGDVVEVRDIPGDRQGPTVQGVQCLIHQGNGNSFPNGQDYLDPNYLDPFVRKIMGGSNNPILAARGVETATSDSLVTLPIYDGHELCPGGSCGLTITIIGFMQIFVERVARNAGGGDEKGDVVARVLSVTGCGAGGSGGGGACGVPGGSGTIGGGLSAIPVRLIRNPEPSAP